MGLTTPRMAVSAVSRQLRQIYRRFPALKVTSTTTTQIRHHGAYYPIDDTVFGLTEDQQQLRKTVFDFCQKELAPKAAEIDKNNNFAEMREFWRKCGDMGLLGITANPDY